MEASPKRPPNRGASSRVSGSTSNLLGGMNVVPTVPIRPIIDWWIRHQPPHQRSNCVCTIGGQCASVESLARTVGASHSTMYRRLRLGVLTEHEADVWAVKVGGIHPLGIWPRYDRLPTCKGVECDA